ncbi:hypothetical protein B4123_2747 [Bacillus paralicheniformis]|uniref:Uncharacterized protein n=1 Tax=Bacillus paralicheniformis TaxID=1648923 RepID=A0ABY3FPV5_9BACI|nr:hypothetical protein SC10_B2orf04371 [Bacillus paralicheniformis]OLG10833.1 hypothetical protein B4123_2747 [Bacillus paralicheniformis]TWJ52268.1 hypothetical protein CHCC5023_4389 [Bacillus paralicheniformis]TWJ65854.1 hypothetical protein CHCC5022_4023 [Bacillus paralicheniformis]TWJ66273.1 hypothetical protein CHCC5021_0549 [Bacillus paralicheniformis]
MILTSSTAFQNGFMISFYESAYIEPGKRPFSRSETDASLVNHEY